jgi:Ca-activated chloride channel family protein
MRWVLLAATLCLALSALLGGTAPLGRVLMAAGLPGLAAPLFSDPGWRGAALYRAGRHAAAEDAFREADLMLNLGDARVMQGAYAGALEAFDAGRMTGDAEAGANFDLVAAFYAGLALDPESPISWVTEKDRSGAAQPSSVAQGNARAAGTGSGVTNAGALIGLPELESLGRLGVRRVFDDKFLVANRRWLSTLSDVPGDYMAARIAFEHKRRDKAGLSPPEPEDPS